MSSVPLLSSVLLSISTFIPLGHTLLIRTLALDIGTRRTGMAYHDSIVGVVLPLDTLEHDSVDAFTRGVSEAVASRHVEALVVGLPLLPSGEEGAQAKSVREYAAALSSLGLPIAFFDERYTTPQGRFVDGDAMAASTILTTYLERKHI